MMLSTLLVFSAVMGQTPAILPDDDPPAAPPPPAMVAPRPAAPVTAPAVVTPVPVRAPPAPARPHLLWPVGFGSADMMPVAETLRAALVKRLAARDVVLDVSDQATAFMGLPATCTLPACAASRSPGRKAVALANVKLAEGMIRVAVSWVDVASGQTLAAVQRQVSPLDPRLVELTMQQVADTFATQVAALLRGPPIATAPPTVQPAAPVAAPAAMATARGKRLRPPNEEARVPWGGAALAGGIGAGVTLLGGLAASAVLLFPPLLFASNLAGFTRLPPAVSGLLPAAVSSQVDPGVQLMASGLGVVVSHGAVTNVLANVMVLMVTVPVSLVVATGIGLGSSVVLAAVASWLPGNLLSFRRTSLVRYILWDGVAQLVLLPARLLVLLASGALLLAPMGYLLYVTAQYALRGTHYVAGNPATNEFRIPLLGYAAACGGALAINALFTAGGAALAHVLIQRFSGRSRRTWENSLQLDIFSVPRLRDAWVEAEGLSDNEVPPEDEDW
jgi:hypothetical protein